MIDFLKIVGSLVLAMGANILLGASIAQLKKVFNKETFLNGLFKGGCIVIGCIFMYLCATLNPSIMIANINGINVNLIEAMRLLFIAGIVLYGAKDLAKLKEIIGVSTEINDVKEKETIIIPEENEIKYEEGK